MTLKKYPILLFVLFACIELKAQQSEDNEIFRGAEVFVSAKVHFIDFAQLNEGLKQYGLPTFNSAKTHLGAGGGVFLNKFYFGGEGVGEINLNSSNDQFKTKLEGGYGMFRFGYTLIRNSNIIFYPVLGIGGGGSAIEIEEAAFNGENEYNFRPGKSIHTGYMILDLGLNNDFIIDLGKGDNANILIGLSAGYQLRPLANWTYEDQSLGEFPNFSTSGFYIRAKIAWWNKP